MGGCRRLQHSFALGGMFRFLRNNNINHDMKQKSPRRRISQLTADPPASSCSKQLPWDSSAAEATGAWHVDGTGNKQIQEDSLETQAWKC